MKKPSLSVCIPTVERLGFLREAVASARAQTDPSVEVLIGDDGNSEELRAWARQVASEDDRVRYLKTPGRLGLAGNWNFLAEHASADFICLIGDDDRLLPEFCTKLSAEVDSDVAVVFCHHHYIDAEGRRRPDLTERATRHYGRDQLRPGRLADPASAVWRNTLPMCASIVRAEAVRRHPFKTDINTPELEFFARLANTSLAFVFVPEFLAEYRVHGTSETSRGLTLDRLVEYLIEIPVPPHVRQQKRALLEGFVVSGVGRRLLRGDHVGASQLAQTGYLPGLRSPRAALTRLCLSLPSPLGTTVFRTATRLAETARQLRSSSRRAATNQP